MIMKTKIFINCDILEINGNVGIGEPFEDIRMLDVDENPNNPGSPGCTLVHPDSIGALDSNLGRLPVAVAGERGMCVCVCVCVRARARACVDFYLGRLPIAVASESGVCVSVCVCE